MGERWEASERRERERGRTVDEVGRRGSRFFLVSLYLTHAVVQRQRENQACYHLILTLHFIVLFDSSNAHCFFQPPFLSHSPVCVVTLIKRLSEPISQAGMHSDRVTPVVVLISRHRLVCVAGQRFPGNVS